MSESSIRVRQRRRPEPALAEASREAGDSIGDPANTEAAEAAYKVGYKSPPKHSQFQPGRSGNPKGRPKGSKNWSTIMAAAADRRRSIGVAGKKVRMSGREAVAEQLVIGAIKGDRAARRDFLNEMRLERQQDPAASRADTPAPEPLGAHDTALLEDFFRRAASRAEEDGT